MRRHRLQPPLLLFAALAVLASPASAAEKTAPANRTTHRAAARVLPHATALDPLNDALFPRELFPEIERHTAGDLLLEGLAAAYPGRVIRAPGPASRTPAPPPRPAVSARLPGNIEYTRCYANADGEIPTPTSTPPSTPATTTTATASSATAVAVAAAPADAHATAVAAAFRIVDLRYFETGPAAAAACARLCEKLFGTAPAYNTLGKYPLGELAGKPLKKPAAPKVKNAADADGTAARTRALVLVNHGTSGPIEAMLADLQARGAVLLVGANTAGNTAVHAPVKGNPRWWSITGEIQPGEKALTLVGTGATPGARVHVSPQTEFLAWRRIENGASPAAVLRLSPNADAAASDDPPTTGVPDLALRRAHDILTALQTMSALAADKNANPANP
jgi:hypothetical protein